MALNNILSLGRPRSARHERLETSEAEADHQDVEAPVATSASGDSEEDLVVETVSDEELEFAEGESSPSNAAPRETTSSAEEEGDEEEADVTDTIPRLSRRATVSLAELETERELARRRTSACVLLAVFVLFRLWVEALQNGDMTVLLICLVSTSWTARFIRMNREREEELDRRITHYLENNNNDGEVDRNDLRMLSFQAQLALAIMDSQRQAMLGGYGHPDGQHGEAAGVSDQAKEQWERFEFKEKEVAEAVEAQKRSSKKGCYGSVALQEQKGVYDDEVPHCSICLGEYEDGEELVKLPCSHVYHDDCVSSWTSNHRRCPLCNLDLESVASDTASTVPEDSIV